MKPEKVRHPTPEQMAAALLKAARAWRWNHWRHELREHAGDWVTIGEMRKPMKAELFARLPEAVAKYQFVELCVYSYKRRIVWGYYCKKLPFEDHMLSGVLVVYDMILGWMKYFTVCVLKKANATASVGVSKKDSL
jgi:hypothetical protein